MISRNRKANNSNLVKPDSLFSASGRGVKGNLTQWRCGIQGRIGLDIESGEPIRRSWAFSMDGPSGQGLYGLLALPNSSMLLHFPNDFSQVDAVESDKTAFDLASRTLHAHRAQSGLILQVTESSIALISACRTSLYYMADILGIPGIRAENAVCTDDAVVVSTHKDGSSQLHTMRIDEMDIRTVGSWDLAGEVTCLSIFQLSGSFFVLTGSVVNSASWISVYAMNGEAIVSEAVNRITGMKIRDANIWSQLFRSLT